MVQITYQTTPNIALIKYWGKKNEELHIPLNSSLSITLYNGKLVTITTIIAEEGITQDTITLNDKTDLISNDAKLFKIINYLRDNSGDYNKNGVFVPSTQLKTYKIKIVTYNKFPTAAGLASSASGWSNLICCMWDLFNVQLPADEKIIMTRIGSGSACRSLFGGYVIWESGIQSDGKDSLSKQLFDENYWPNIRVLILVLDDHKKTVSSREGMKRTAATSTLIKERMNILPGRISEIIDAIKIKDFRALSSIIRMDSNQFHSLCLDTYPPLHYMNDVSFYVIDIIHMMEDLLHITIAYTYDAGPNPTLVFEESDTFKTDNLIKLFQHLQDPKQHPNPYPTVDWPKHPSLNIIDMYPCTVGSGPVCTTPN